MEGARPVEMPGHSLRGKPNTETAFQVKRKFWISRNSKSSWKIIRTQDSVSVIPLPARALCCFWKERRNLKYVWLSYEFRFSKKRKHPYFASVSPPLGLFPHPPPSLSPRRCMQEGSASMEDCSHMGQLRENTGCLKGLRQSPCFVKIRKNE